METLRQSISKGQITSLDSYQFRQLSLDTISFLTTCSVFEKANDYNSVVSTRLSRLFSIFVLPSQSLKVILSVHSPRLNHWLKNIPLQHNIEGLASCIITATKSLYHAVSETFQPTSQRPHFIFSHQDLQKVFSGMCLWKPGIQNAGALQIGANLVPYLNQGLLRPATTLKIAHIWMHESMRTFGDRLCSDDESRTLVSLITETALVHFGITALDVTQSVSGDEPLNRNHHTNTPPSTASEPASQCNSFRNCSVSSPSPLTEHNPSAEVCLKRDSLQTHILQHMQRRLETFVYGPDLSASINEQHHFKCSYQEQAKEALLQQLSELIKKDKNNENQYDIVTRCVVHRQRMEHLLHIVRALLISGGHGVLISSSRGTGRKTTLRLAAQVTGYQLMEVHPGNENKLRQILKEAVNQTRVGDDNVIVLVHEGVSHHVREEVLVAMAHRSYPGLHTDEEMRELVSRVTEGKYSQRYLMDSWVFEK